MKVQNRFFRTEPHNNWSLDKNERVWTLEEAIQELVDLGANILCSAPVIELEYRQDPDDRDGGYELTVYGYNIFLQKRKMMEDNKTNDFQPDGCLVVILGIIAVNSVHWFGCVPLVIYLVVWAWMTILNWKKNS